MLISLHLGALDYFDIIGWTNADPSELTHEFDATTEDVFMTFLSEFDGVGEFAAANPGTDVTQSYDAEGEIVSPDVSAVTVTARYPDHVIYTFAGTGERPTLHFNYAFKRNGDRTSLVSHLDTDDEDTRLRNRIVTRYADVFCHKFDEMMAATEAELGSQSGSV
ncbi:MAG: hypothetical protein WA979_00530 [Pacificimonas sp.]